MSITTPPRVAAFKINQPLYLHGGAAWRELAYDGVSVPFGTTTTWSPGRRIQGEMSPMVAADAVGALPVTMIAAVATTPDIVSAKAKASARENRNIGSQTPCGAQLRTSMRQLR